MIYSKIFTVVVAVMFAVTAQAQSITRAEFAHYDLRADSDSRTRTSKVDYIPFAPEFLGYSGDVEVFEQLIEAPQSWSDMNTYLHLESVGGAYEILVNESVVARSEDTITPSEYDITKYLSRGENSIKIAVFESALAELEEGVEMPEQPRFGGSYISNQERVKILDYMVNVEREGSTEHGRLHIDIIVENRFNYDESIEVGYDIYDPAGKLMEFNTSLVTLAGNSRDTVRFSPYLYGAERHKWTPSARGGNQPLYSVTLYNKKNRVPTNYIPFKVAYAPNSVALKPMKYNADQSAKATEIQLRKIKSVGVNTITPDYPQPLWFYELCDKIGLYVVEQASINAPAHSDDRAVGGSPSNDPALKDEYLSRVKKSYYRTRNFSCVIAYSLGGDSGNGYNMYKAYQWLKSVESRRPVFYVGAKGEWNSDALNLAK